MSAAFSVVFWGVAVIYALAVAAQLYGQAFHRPSWQGRASWVIAAGLGVHTVLVAWRWGATGHAPVMGNFENALVGAWFIVAMALWTGWRQRHAVVAAATLPVALILLAIGGLTAPMEGPLEASLQSTWLWIHVFFAWLAHGGYAVACGAGVVFLARTAGGKTPAPESLVRLEELMMSSTVFGFVTDAVMLAAGSLWAKKLWGSYWSWDPVETWSLVSWLTYGLALHLRRTLGWRGRKLAWLVVLAIVFVLISFWGVNLVMAGSEHIMNVG